MLGTMRIIQCVSAFTVTALFATSAGSDVSLQERKLGSVPRNLSPKDVTFSPNGKFVSFQAWVDGEQTVYIQGDQEKVLSGARNVVFSGDGEHWACAKVNKNGTFSTIIDGKSGPEVSHEITRLVLNRTGGRHAYVAKEATGKYAAVIDGAKGDECEAVLDLLFSPDGKRWACTSRGDGKSYAVVDGVKGDGYRTIRTLRFSDDGQHVAYGAHDTTPGKSLAYLVLDGKRGQECETLLLVGFSHKGASVRYLARREGVWSAYDGEKALMTLEHKFPYSPVFSADGKRLAYLVKTSGTATVVVDGKPGPSFPEIWGNSLRFSPDGRRLAYVASDGGKSFVVADGVAGEKYEMLDWDSVTFSPDGKKVAYRAGFGNVRGRTEPDQWFVVMDASRVGPFDAVGNVLSFDSPEGRLSFGARKDRELWWKVIEIR
jgi:WD40 repeat protein